MTQSKQTTKDKIKSLETSIFNHFDQTPTETAIKVLLYPLLLFSLILLSGSLSDHTCWNKDLDFTWTPTNNKNDNKNHNIPGGWMKRKDNTNFSPGPSLPLQDSHRLIQSEGGQRLAFFILKIPSLDSESM